MPDPLISVLLPSRGRPEALAESVGSLRHLATDPDRVEVLVASDDDDPPTDRAARALGARSLVGPRWGYPRLQMYVNALAHHANGTWLLLWNDDARMLTKGWDERVAEAEPGVLWPSHNDSPMLNIFPVVHRRLVELLGHFSLSAHCDSWVQDVAQAVGIHHRIPVGILHDRFDLTGGHDDQTYRDAQAGYRTADYHSPEMSAARQRDIETLRTHWSTT
jgi:glycosyltransferase involved in cell wall biosynthesis